VSSGSSRENKKEVRKKFRYKNIVEAYFRSIVNLSKEPSMQLQLNNILPLEPLWCALQILAPCSVYHEFRVVEKCFARPLHHFKEFK
jgi:hypothetical protein